MANCPLSSVARFRMEIAVAVRRGWVANFLEELVVVPRWRLVGFLAGLLVAVPRWRLADFLEGLLVAVPRWRLAGAAVARWSNRRLIPWGCDGSMPGQSRGLDARRPGFVVGSSTDQPG